MPRPAIAAQGVLDEAGLVQRVAVQRDLESRTVGDPQAGVDDRRCRTPVLVQLEARGTRRGLSSMASSETVFPLPSRATLIGRPSIASNMRLRCHGAGGDRGGLGALGRTGAAGDPGGDARAERLVDLLGCDQVHVAVDGAGGEDAAVAGDDLGGRADDQPRVDAVHRVGVAGLAEGDDAAVPDADVGLDDAPVVEHHGAGDDQVERTLGAGGDALPHRLADDLAAAEDDLVAAVRAAAAVLGHLDEQVGVGQPDPVAGGRAEQRGVARRG